jgi:protoheme ferro-lyase
MVEAKLTELIEKDPAKYIRIWVENPNKEFNYMVEEALSKNIIRKNRSAYYFGTDLIGNGIDDVIAYLKDKKNQDILLSIKKEIESK